MTTINLINSNYNVVSESASLKMDGNCNWSDNRIANMYLNVYNLDSIHLGSISYNQMESENVNMNLDMKYMMEALTLLSTIINDIEGELKK